MARHVWAVFAIIFSLIGGLAGSQAPTQAANLLEKGIWLSGPLYDGDLPPCESALGTISSQFAEKESGFWNSAVQINGFEQVREVAFRPWQSSTIPRRFCESRALMSDGKVTMVRYSIIEDGGLAGYGAGVEWCVVGYDRNWAYNPACRIARP